MDCDWQKLPPTAESLEKILKRLRAPGGCPWDREQTPQTLARCLTGEVAEFLDALDLADADNACEELGDILMNLIFQAVVAEEEGLFTWEEVVRRIDEKMIRRHPHVFGDASAADPEAVKRQWEEIKAREKGPAHAGPKSILAKLPQSLSALDTATEIQKRVSKVGFDWVNTAGIVDKIAEELDEVREALASGDDEAIDEEIGDLLFAVVNLSRYRKRLTAEEALRRANLKFRRRFEWIEADLHRHGIPLAGAGIGALERAWQEAKKHE